MDYTLNNYRFRKLGSHYFVTTDSGSWAVLSENEFDCLKSSKIDSALYKKLAESEIVLDEFNQQEYISDLQRRHSQLFNGTSLHIIVVTLRCNMKCVYCHASSVDESKLDFDMTPETAKKTVDFIFQSSSPNIAIEFQGGEPLLNWDIVKYIVEYALLLNKKSRKQLKFAIVTNLSLMDEEKMEFLIQNKIPLCTSLDGPKQVHDNNRVFLGGSNYEQVLFWINKFNDEYKKRNIPLSVFALPTLTRESLNYPDQIVDEYASLSIPTIHLRFLNSMGVAKKSWPAIGYSAQEYLDFWKQAMARIAFHNQKGHKISERIAEIIAQKIGTKFDPGYLDLRSPCGAAIGQMVYSQNGSIYTCDEARMVGDDTFLLGNVFDDKYSQVATCSKACAVINSSINDSYLCDACAYKPYCGLCPVCSFAENGSLITQVSNSLRCKIFKAQFDWVVSERFINLDKTNTAIKKEEK